MSGLSRKLILYFMSVIVAFALIIGVVFSLTYQTQTQDRVEQELIVEGNHLVLMLKESADLKLSESLIQSTLDRLTLENVQIWTIDLTGNITYYTQRQTGTGMMRNTNRLSETTQSVLQDVLEGQQVTSEAIRGMMSSDALTVGTPVIVNNEIVGGLFIGAAISEISTLSQEGLNILFIALGFGLFLAIGLGYFLSLNFSKPLTQASVAINKLTLGDYNIHFSKHRPDEIGQLTQNIVKLSDELEVARDAQANLEKMRQNFISDITHELRTPVTIVRGLVEGLKDGVYQPSDVVYDQIIQESVDMQRLINDLLELSKLEDPDFKIEAKPFEWHELLSDTTRSASLLLKRKQQTLDVQIEAQQWNGNGDVQRLKQMFLAIIDNASKFSPQGASITFLAKKEGQHLIIKITDHGKGMSSLQMSELFKRYKKDSQNNPNGNGLGLLIVSKIAQKHHIHVEVNSKEHQGSTFSFTIDLA